MGYNFWIAASLVARVAENAGIAQLVERNLAKVEVESSRLFSRSRFPKREASASLFRQSSQHGAIAKRLCPGLQIRLVQFDSGSRLHLFIPCGCQKAQQCWAFLFPFSLCVSRLHRLVDVCSVLGVSVSVACALRRVCDRFRLAHRCDKQPFLVISLSKALYFSGIILQVHLKKCAKIVAILP